MLSFVLAIKQFSSLAPASLPPLPSAVTFSDFLAIGLTILGLMIALASVIVTSAGLAVGVAAVFGYQAFKEEVGKKASETSERVAAKTARIVVDEYFKGDEFDAKLKGTRKLYIQRYKPEPEPETPIGEAVKKVQGAIKQIKKYFK